MYFSGFKNLIILSQGRSVRHLNDTHLGAARILLKFIRLGLRNGMC